MLEPDTAALLETILKETQSGRLKWTHRDDDCWAAEVGANVTPILIWRSYIEASNQVGADPYFINIMMSGWNARFAIVNDSDGWRAVRAILEAAFPGSWATSAASALAQLKFKLGIAGDV